MSKIQCVDCGSAHDSREMRGCKSCGASVCGQCAARQGNFCTDCAGQDECIVPD